MEFKSFECFSLCSSKTVQKLTEVNHLLNITFKNYFIKMFNI